MKKNDSLINYLQKIYGVQKYKAKEFAIFIGANPNIKYNQLSFQKKESLTKVIAFYKKSRQSDAIFKNLKTYQQQQIQHKIKINTLAGRRFKLKLPTRGQRTRSNAKTAFRLN